jgi:hypothetical protein
MLYSIVFGFGGGRGTLISSIASRKESVAELDLPQDCDIPVHYGRGGRDETCTYMSARGADGGLIDVLVGGSRIGWDDDDADPLLIDRSVDFVLPCTAESEYLAERTNEQEGSRKSEIIMGFSHFATTFTFATDSGAPSRKRKMRSPPPLVSLFFVSQTKTVSLAHELVAQKRRSCRTRDEKRMARSSGHIR